MYTEVKTKTNASSYLNVSANQCNIIILVSMNSFIVK
jgi:hypothetical protein